MATAATQRRGSARATTLARILSGLTVRTRQLLHRNVILQGGVLLAIWLVGDVVVHVIGLPIPGGVLGMLLMLALLLTRSIHPASVRRGSQWLLGNMLLFFVPPMLAVMNHGELFSLLGIKILLIIVVGTVLVMGVTVSTVELCTRWRAARGVAKLPG